MSLIAPIRRLARRMRRARLEQAELRLATLQDAMPRALADQRKRVARLRDQVRADTPATNVAEIRQRIESRIKAWVLE